VEDRQFGKAVKAYETAVEKTGSKRIKTYQKYLTKKGYYKGELNGEYGKDVHDAMVACVNNGCKMGID
jgi:hypothetical protein